MGMGAKLSRGSPTSFVLAFPPPARHAPSLIVVAAAQPAPLCATACGGGCRTDGWRTGGDLVLAVAVGWCIGTDQTVAARCARRGRSRGDLPPAVELGRTTRVFCRRRAGRAGAGFRRWIAGACGTAGRSGRRLCWRLRAHHRTAGQPAAALSGVRAARARAPDHVRRVDPLAAALSCSRPICAGVASVSLRRVHRPRWWRNGHWRAPASPLKRWSGWVSGPETSPSLRCNRVRSMHSATPSRSSPCWKTAVRWRSSVTRAP